MATTKTDSKPKSASAKQVATAYFDAIKARDLDAMVAVWKPGGTDYLYGMADLKVPRGPEGLLRRPVPRLPRLRDGGGRHRRLRRQGRRPLAGDRDLHGRREVPGADPDRSLHRIEGLDLLTVADGLIVENRAYTDSSGLARQLGAMPPAGSIGEKAMLGMVNARTSAVDAVRRLRERG